MKCIDITLSKNITVVKYEKSMKKGLEFLKKSWRRIGMQPLNYQDLDSCDCMGSDVVCNVFRKSYWTAKNICSFNKKIKVSGKLAVKVADQ